MPPRDPPRYQTGNRGWGEHEKDRRSGDGEYSSHVGCSIRLSRPLECGSQPGLVEHEQRRVEGLEGFAFASLAPERACHDRTTSLHRKFETLRVLLAAQRPLGSASDSSPETVSHIGTAPHGGRSLTCLSCPICSVANNLAPARPGLAPFWTDRPWPRGGAAQFAGRRKIGDGEPVARATAGPGIAPTPSTN